MLPRSFLPCFAALSLLLSTPCAFAEEERPARPEGGLLRFTKWTPNFEVPDPVAISFDPRGRAYVTQTQRRKANDLDIRENYDWLVDDLSFESVEDKIRFYEAQFTPGNSAANAKRVPDLNGDGLHDLRDLLALSERVYLISDESGDGSADTIRVFAEEMDHLVGGVAGGVLYHEGEVFVSPVPELLRFRDTTGDDQADQREVVASGFGVHLAFAGHDMHGLFVGPDGRIYWSIGDKGLRVQTDDGFDYRYPNQGALVRCEPDGSGFEVFARGQRNIQEHSFDQYGNIFGVDNDADFPGERERLVFVEQYLDTGWRANWQYRRGDYNPWMAERMDVPYEPGQPLWFTPALANYENGPAGFKFNPGTALGPDYHGYFFMTSAPMGQQWAFRIEPLEDRFAMVDDHKIGEGVALVGLDFSPDGSLFGVDWGGGYPLNESGAVWRIDLDPERRDPRREDTQARIAADFSKESEAGLLDALAHADQRVRLKAQFELVRRDALPALIAASRDRSGDQLARIHAIWGLGQLLRQGQVEGADDGVFVPLFADPDPEIRAQTLKTASDHYGRRLGLDRTPGPLDSDHPLAESFAARLADPELRVRVQALLALGRLGDPAHAAAVVECLADPDHHFGLTYLRHAGVVALAGSAPTELLEALSAHPSSFVRGCVVVALRRRGEPAVSRFLADPDPLVAAEAARAIHDDWSLPESLEPLAAALELAGDNEPFARRAINANFRLGGEAHAARLAAYLGVGDAPAALLEAAMRALLEWVDPAPLDLVEGRYRPLGERDPALLKKAVAGSLDELLTSRHDAVRTGGMELARIHQLPVSNETLVTVALRREAAPALRAEALRTLASQQAPQLAATVAALLEDPAGAVARTALERLLDLDPVGAVAEIRRRLEESADDEDSLRLRQHAVRLLSATAAALGEESAEILGGLVAALATGALEPGLGLDALETARDEAFAGSESIRGSVDALDRAWQEALSEDPLAPYRIALEGGEPARGADLFVNHAAAQCIRCHRIDDGKGSLVGPTMKSIGTEKDAEYLLESLVDPQAVIAEGYGTIALTLNDGTFVTGLYRGEKDGKVTVRDPEGTNQRIPADSIAQRSPVVSTMPPMGMILQPGELRDLIAYLKSL